MSKLYRINEFAAAFDRLLRDVWHTVHVVWKDHTMPVDGTGSVGVVQEARAKGLPIAHAQ